MNFISTRIITADVKRLAEFYELVTGVTAVWGKDPSPWIDIPDDVPRDYLTTAAWVRAQASS